MQVNSIKGYNLLSEEYISANEKLTIKHIECGSIFDMTYAKFVTCNNRCPICFGTHKHTYEFVKNEIENIGYTLLSKEYKNALTKLDIKCNNGHIFKLAYNGIQQGKRCKICSYKSCGQKRALSYGFIKTQFENVGYTLLSKEYKNNHNNLKVKCDKGHVYEVTWNNFDRGTRCPICNIEKTSSKAEREIQEYVKTLNVKQINNDRSQILNKTTGRYLELDIYLPEINKAIEYNGKYWHSMPLAIERDKLKKEECERLGIDLFIIKEQEYINNKNVVLIDIYNFIWGWNGFDCDS